MNFGLNASATHVLGDDSNLSQQNEASLLASHSCSSSVERFVRSYLIAFAGCASVPACCNFVSVEIKIPGKGFQCTNYYLGPNEQQLGVS